MLGKFQLLVKDYPDSGTMSRYIHGLSVGDTVRLRARYTRCSSPAQDAQRASPKMQTDSTTAGRVQAHRVQHQDPVPVPEEADRDGLRRQRHHSHVPGET
jgi:hypothetical protein